MKNSNKIFEVAKYFIYKNNLEKRKGLTNKKLNKLLYYSQVWFYFTYNKTLFDNKIEAWPHGPAIPEIYYKYKKFECYDIKENVSDNFNLSKEEKDMMDWVWSIYGKYDADYLEGLTHSERPWQKARTGLDDFDFSHNEILLSDMYKYCESLTNKNNK